MEMQKGQSEIVKMIELETELMELKKRQGIDDKPPLWIRAGDWIVNHMHEPHKVSYKKYMKLAISCGWFCGAHQFYSGHRIAGILYLLLCWTGISMAMTFIDILLVYLKNEPDEAGMIYL